MEHRRYVFVHAGAHGMRRRTRIEHSGCNDSVVVHPRREKGNCLREHQRSTIAHHRLEHFARRLLLESSFAIQTESVKGLAFRESPPCRAMRKRLQQGMIWLQSQVPRSGPPRLCREGVALRLPLQKLRRKEVQPDCKSSAHGGEDDALRRAKHCEDAAPSL